jgi:hypothetical protein
VFLQAQAILKSQPNFPQTPPTCPHLIIACLTSRWYLYSLVPLLKNERCGEGSIVDWEQATSKTPCRPPYSVPRSNIFLSSYPSHTGIHCARDPKIHFTLQLHQEVIRRLHVDVRGRSVNTYQIPLFTLTSRSRSLTLFMGIGGSSPILITDILTNVFLVSVVESSF